MNFDIFYKKTLCLGKTAITFAYEVGLKSFLYEKVSTRKVTPPPRGKSHTGRDKRSPCILSRVAVLIGSGFHVSLLFGVKNGQPFDVKLYKLLEIYTY
jgi:hypothetical protein